MIKNSTDFKIDVVYVNYHSYDDIIRSINSLYKIFLKDPSLFFNVFIVDNSFCEARNELSTRLVNYSTSKNHESFQIKYIPSNSNIGFGSACNKGSKHGKSNHILFVNCDTDFRTTNIKELKNLLLLCKNNVAIAAPKIINENNYLHSSCFSFDPISILLKPFRTIRKIGKFTKFIPEYSLIKKRIDRITYEGLDKSKPTLVDWLSGCFLIIRRDFFESVEGFDSRFFMYFEDVDICRKARKFGLKTLFEPRIKIVHRGSYQSSRGKNLINILLFNKAARYHIISWLKYLYKWRFDFYWKILSKFKSKAKNNDYIDNTIEKYNLNFSSFEIFEYESNYPKKSRDI